MNLFTLEGRTAVVTGASGALGGAMAAGLARAGANTVLCYGRNREGADALKARLEQEGVSGRIAVSQVDAADA